MIKAENIVFSYDDDSSDRAVDGVSLYINEGEAVAILGRNSSGKSTLGKLFNGLLIPGEGDVVVFGKNTRLDDIWEIRKSCGMVFQNPDSQIVASIVEEDIAFGLENIGIPQNEMEERIDKALAVVDMSEYKTHSTQDLSGGQKQKVAVAGIFAMRPKCIILDEATSMLDPVGRGAVLSAVFRLRDDFGISVVMITHFIDEAAMCDRVYVMDRGRIELSGTPQEVLVQGERLLSLGLEAPFYVRLAQRLGIEEGLYSCEKICDKISEMGEFASSDDSLPMAKADKESIISVKGLSYSYDKKHMALSSVNLEVKEGSFTAIIGHTGSGKSTLLRLLNGIYKPVDGSVFYRDKGIDEIKDIRRKIGIVFQNPDYQLFEETVIKDVMFGGLNMGMTPEEAEEKAKKALEMVGFSLEKIEKSPFELSGGEKKRVSIAGILIMEPEVLVLDEPAAGLDPRGRREVLKIVKDIQRQGLTVVMVTHSMEAAAELSDYVVVLNKGRVYTEGSPSEVFEKDEELEKIGLGIPEGARLKNKLSEMGIFIRGDVFSPEEIGDSLKCMLQ